MGSMRSRLVAAFIAIILVLPSALLVTGCGNSPLTEVNEAIETVFVKTFSKTFGGSGDDSASSILQTSDGGHILAGSTESFGNGKDAYLVKTDAAGNLLWEKNYGGPDDDSLSSMQLTTDGGYILAGSTYYPDNDLHVVDVYLVKIDASGKIQWEKNFGGGDQQDAKSVCQATDGGYVVAGFSRPQTIGAYHPAYLAKTDASGNLLWEKSLDFGEKSYINHIQQTINGGYVVAGGVRNDGNWDALIAELDTSGNVLWGEDFGGTSNEIFNSIQYTADGCFVVAGSTGADPYGNGGDAYFVKLGASGNLLWERTFGHSSDYASSVKQTTDGCYILAGGTGADLWEGIEDAYLIKTDASGNLLWEKTFNYDEGRDSFSSVQQTKDGGFVMAGTTGGTYNDSDIYLVKTDAEGNSGGGGGGSEETVPVVLVHGWNGEPGNWDTLVSALEAKGMDKWEEGDTVTGRSILVFDYGDRTTEDPRNIAKGQSGTLFGTHDYEGLDGFIDENLGDWIEGGGQIDIICHSMGALVTRWWMEELDNGDNAANVRQWIGIAPASHGSATADAAIDSVGDPAGNSFQQAVVQLQTNSDTVTTLDKDGIQEGLSAGVKYHVLAGVNQKQNKYFFANVDLYVIGDLEGQTFDRQTRSDGSEYNAKTYLGDSFVSMNQSMLDGATNEYFEGLDHNQIIKDTDVSETVWGYLINPSKVISQDSADDGLVTVPNIIGMRIGDANSAIEGVGLVLYVNGCSMDGSKHEVTKQDPPVGTKVTKGTTIEIFYDGELE